MGGIVCVWLNAGTNVKTFTISCRKTRKEIVFYVIDNQ